jgi:capsular exopolysaccharide synthesis family protein
MPTRFRNGSEVTSNQQRGLPVLNWLGGGRLQKLTFMHDHIYKVLWKLLMEADRENKAPNHKTVETNGNAREKKAKKTSYAIAFASVKEGEGASTMAFNFASAFAAHSSGTVVLVDGNLKDPVLHHEFEVKKKKGLVDVIAGKTTVEDAVTEVIPKKYYFLQAGQTEKDPVAILESRKFSLLVRNLRERYDLIIFDSSSVLGGPGTELIASNMDGLILVVQANRTRWEVARSAKRDLESAHIRVLGAILNKQQFIIPEAIYKRL